MIMIQTKANNTASFVRRARTTSADDADMSIIQQPLFCRISSPSSIPKGPAVDVNGESDSLPANLLSLEDTGGQPTRFSTPCCRNDSTTPRLLTISEDTLRDDIGSGTRS